MTTSPFSVRFSDDLKQRLEKIAIREDRSIGYLVQQAVEEFVDAKESFYEELAKAEAELDKGIFISEDAMMKWMESWGSDNELPPPEPDIFPDKAKDVA